ncbi:unnamed protein product [Prunus brigantina]
MISQRGIEANPEKIQAILDMAIPKKVKDIQSLIGRVAALTRFIFKATDRCAPFFKALKGSKRSVTWTAECDKAFSELMDTQCITSAKHYKMPRVGTRTSRSWPSPWWFRLGVSDHTFKLTPSMY